MRLLAIAVLLGACKKEPAPDSGKAGPSDVPTFHQDVLPIVGEKCQQCHSSTDPMGGAFPLESYEQIYAFSSVLLNKMNPEGDAQDPFFMPPFNARSTEDCAPPHPFRGTYEVSPEEYAVFSAWVEGGMPEGDASSPTPFTVPPVVGLEGAVTELSFAGDYTVTAPASGTYDSFRCFAMQTEDGVVAAPSDLWIDGFEFTPGNTAVAHHMLLYTVPNLAAHMEDGLVEDSANHSWDCDGAVSRSDGAYMVGDFDLVWGWVPGGLPLDLQWDMGMRLNAGTGLVIQMHYNTLANPENLVDSSRLGIRLRDEPPEREARFRLIGVGSTGASAYVDDPPFEVPLGATSHVESYTERMGVGGVRLWGFIPHMHLAGTAIDFRKGGESGDTCLVNVPRYDYNWQQMYTYDTSWEELPVLDEDDALRVSCTYNNSESNVMLQKYLGGPVTDGVRLGDGTGDEMCIVALGYACEGLCE